MLPYLNLVSFAIGPLTIYTWGLLAAAGFAASLFLSVRLSKKKGLENKILYDLFSLMIVSSLIGGRIFYVIFYHWAYFSNHWPEIFYIWDGGLSSYGGFFGALTALILYFYIKQINFWSYADLLAFSFPFGWSIGRLGCALINDHPGKLTNLFFGVKYPDGVRHDLGLEEMLLTIVLAVVFIVISSMSETRESASMDSSPVGKGQHPEGFYVIFLGLWYGVTRFFLDFLRVEDTRLVGLTPAQYFSIILVAVSLTLFWQRTKINLDKKIF